jgi:hypothetical protein
MASRIHLRGPAELLSAMPYLLGFHPANSLVVLGLRGPGLHLQLRGDLPGDHAAAAVLADHYGRLFRRNGLDGALLIGYGPPERAEPFLRTVAAAMRVRGVAVLDMLRTHEGRYWSLLCEVPDCCPAEGRPYDPETSMAAAEATLAGMVALPDRATVAASFAGPTGPALAAIEEAADRASLRVVHLTEGRARADVRAAIVAAGRAALDAALACYAAGRRVTDDEVAWLQVLLLVKPFRDRAWERLDRDMRRLESPAAEAHRLLWTDLVRRCEPAAVAPSATLLSYLSWRTGNGLHASLVLDRALVADPRYSAAILMAEILGRGMSPTQMPAVAETRPRRLRTTRRRVTSRTPAIRPRAASGLDSAPPPAPSSDSAPGGAGPGRDFGGGAGAGVRSDGRAGLGGACGSGLGAGQRGLGRGYALGLGRAPGLGSGPRSGSDFCSGADGAGAVDGPGVADWPRVASAPDQARGSGEPRGSLEADDSGEPRGPGEAGDPGAASCSGEVGGQGQVRGSNAVQGSEVGGRVRPAGGSGRAGAMGGLGRDVRRRRR